MSGSDTMNPQVNRARSTAIRRIADSRQDAIGRRRGLALVARPVPALHAPSVAPLVALSVAPSVAPRSATLVASLVATHVASLVASLVALIVAAGCSAPQRDMQTATQQSSTPRAVAPSPAAQTRPTESQSMQRTLPSQDPGQPLPVDDPFKRIDPSAPGSDPVTLQRDDARSAVRQGAAGAAESASAAGPARLAGASSGCLQRIESHILGDSGVHVMLGAGAFAHSDRLVLEQIQPLDAQGRQLDGRRRAAPAVVYRLRMVGDGQCMIQRESAGKARPQSLSECQCARL